VTGKQQKRWTLDPKLDVVFKLLFGSERNKPLLISLLTAILDPPAAIVDVEVLNGPGPPRLKARNSSFGRRVATKRITPMIPSTPPPFRIRRTWTFRTRLAHVGVRVWECQAACRRVTTGK
jgi:hypothetical protein